MGTKVGIGGCPQKVRAVLEGELVGNYARSDFLRQLFKMFGSMLNPEITTEIFELVCTCRHSTRGIGQVVPLLLEKRPAFCRLTQHSSE